MVCFGLGSGDEKTSKLFHFLQSGLDPRLEDDDVYYVLSFPEDTITFILNSKYWTRTWIVQEILLGREKGFITLGPNSISLQDLATTLQQGSRKDRFHSVLKTAGWTFFNYEDDFAPAGAGSPSNAGLGSPGKGEWWFTRLLVHLRDFGQCECRDVRDRTYVMLILLGCEAVKVVDYTISARELYAKLISTWMRGVSLHLEPSSLEGIARVETLLRKVLKLSDNDRSLCFSEENDVLWCLAMELERVFSRPVTNTSRFLREPEAKGMTLTPNLFQLLISCTCMNCGNISLPAGRNCSYSQRGRLRQSTLSARTLLWLKVSASSAHLHIGSQPSKHLKSQSSTHFLWTRSTRRRFKKS